MTESARGAVRRAQRRRHHARGRGARPCGVLLTAIEEKPIALQATTQNAHRALVKLFVRDDIANARPRLGGNDVCGELERSA